MSMRIQKVSRIYIHNRVIAIPNTAVTDAKGFIVQIPDVHQREVCPVALGRMIVQADLELRQGNLIELEILTGLTGATVGGAEGAAQFRRDRGLHSQLSSMHRDIAGDVAEHILIRGGIETLVIDQILDEPVETDRLPFQWRRAAERDESAEGHICIGTGLGL